MSRTIRILVRTAAIAVVVLLIAGCERQGELAPIPPATIAGMTVSVTQVSNRRVDERITVLGNVSAWEEIVINSRSSGLAVIGVYCAENSRVSAGDLLARLDDRILNAQIAQQQAVIEEAQTNNETATQKAARANVLVVTQAVSKEFAEDQRAAVKTTKAKLDQAKAVLEQLQAQLDQTRITSPADGYISQKPVVLGTVVQLGTELLRVIKDSRLEVEAKVPEQKLAAIRNGQTAFVNDPGGGDIETTVRAVAAKVDGRTRLGVVYVGLPAQSRLKPGMFARVSINVASRQALTVPEAALIWRADRPSVFVVDDANRATLTSVVTGERQTGDVEVKSGLSGNDRVVVSGAGFVNDGDTVRVAVAADATNTEQTR